MILGVLLYELRKAGRISEEGASTIASLAIPESCWGIHGIDIHEAVAQAVQPRVYQRRLFVQARDGGAA